MSNVLVLFAHPLLEKSRVHTALLHYAKDVHGVTINDLYQIYPDFDIDIEREQQLLLSHDIIIWQHPFYWYNAPAILKQWQDIVLEHGWAYGRKGTALAGKKVLNVLSSGGPFEAYQHGGYNKYPIHDFLRPFERTAELCKMTYWPPFWIHGTHRLDENGIETYARQYRSVLTALVKDIFSEEEILSQAVINNLFPFNSTEV